MSTPDFAKNLQTQLCPQLLPQTGLFRLRRRGRQGRVHQHCIGANGFDLLPRNGQALVPAKQSEQPGPAQQDQALQLCGGRVKGQVVGPAKADALFQLHHLFFTQFPDGHGALPFLPQLMRQLYR